MILAGGTVAMSAFMTLIGMWISFRIEKNGLPEAYNAQAVKRRGKKLKARMPQILINLALVWTSTFLGLWTFGHYFPMETPSLWVLIPQLFIVFVADDALFYWYHRLLHVNTTLYRWIHQRHHEAYAPVPIEYIYVHPLEWMLGMSGFVLGFGICLGVWGSMSAWTLWIWGGWRTLHELDIHSGMNLMNRIPLFASMQHHDLHHARPHCGNYASMFPFWDRVYGTEVTEMPRGNRKETGAAK